jgi:DNA-directed RNA polymerase subunit RPC12/RpoP
MATCKECLHYEACVLNEAYWVKHNADQACSAFKDKSKYVEQKHSRWLGTHDGWYYSYSCSECGSEALTKEETMHDQVCSNYCPNCGAKMDGEIW